MAKEEKRPKKIKHAVAKRKNIERSHKYSIDFGEKTINIVGLDGAGGVVKSATVDAPQAPEKPDAAYTQALAKAVKKAKRAAKIPRSTGLPCVIITGGPHVIIRRFTWPEMPDAALRSNAVNEITSFLPDEAGNYTISHRVVNRQVSTENSIARIDVLVAAIPTANAKAVTDAATKAGFAPARLDVHENARNKIARTVRMQPKPDEERLEPASVAILDINGPRVNISLYLHGMFYSNRYFAANAQENEAAVDEEPGEAREAAPIDTDALANEVASIIDYIQYRERGSEIECILIYGDDDAIPTLYQSLTDNMDIPIFKTGQWLRTGYCRDHRYLDAFGAAISSAYGSNLPPRLAADLDLRPPKRKNALTQLLPPVACTLAVLGIALYFGITIPNNNLADLRATGRDLDRQLSGYPLTSADLAVLSNSITSMRTQIGEVENFYKEWPGALDLLPVMNGFQNGGRYFQSFSVSGDSASANGQSADFDDFSDLLYKMRANNYFSSVRGNSAVASSADGEQAANDRTAFSFTIGIRAGTGAR